MKGRTGRHKEMYTERVQCTEQSCTFLAESWSRNFHLIVNVLMVCLLCLAFTGEGGTGAPGTSEDDHGRRR